MEEIKMRILCSLAAISLGILTKSILVALFLLIFWNWILSN